MKQLSIWIIALFAITVTNPAWAANSKIYPTPGGSVEGYPKAVGITSIELKWTKGNDNVTPQNKLRYWVDWKKKSGGMWDDSSLSTDITTYTLTGLEPIIEFLIDLEDPTPGKYGTFTSTLTTITMNWTKGNDNVTPQNKLRYQVSWNKIGGPGNMSEWMTDITTYTITGLEPNSEYLMNVRVRDESINYTYYGEKYFRTQAPVDNEPPKGGSYVSGYPKAVGTTSIELKWTKATDNVTPQNRLMYVVSWNKVGGPRDRSEWMTDITTYTITGLEPNTKYEVEVEVWDEGGYNKYYGGRTIKTNAVPDYQRPTAGSYGTITAKANSITVNWTRGTDNVTPQNKLRYKVVWKKKSSTMFGNGSILYTDMTSYTLTDLKPDTEYILEVQVWDEANNYKFYGERTVKTKPAADTQAPDVDDLSVTGEIKETAYSIEFKVQPATDNVTPQNKLKYVLYYIEEKGTEWKKAMETVGITTFKLESLKPNTRYQIELYVYDESGNKSRYDFPFAFIARTKPAVIAVTGVTLSPASLSLEVGQTGGLTATVAPATATNKKVTWSSSNTAVATVDGSGTVKGIAPGTVTITVKTVDGNKTATATVTVKEKTKPTVNVTSVTLNRDQVTINGDYDEVQLTATVAPSDATDQSLTWTSDNPQVASVDGAGLVRIHKKGKARITVKANDGSGKSASCLFDVIQTVGNETVDGLRMWAHGSALHLTLPNAVTVHIYNVSGTMVKTLALPAGDHVQPLADGMYLVRVGEQVTKIFVK